MACVLGEEGGLGWLAEFMMKMEGSRHWWGWVWEDSINWLLHWHRMLVKHLWMLAWVNKIKVLYTPFLPSLFMVLAYVNCNCKCNSWSLTRTRMQLKGGGDWGLQTAWVYGSEIYSSVLLSNYANFTFLQGDSHHPCRCGSFHDLLWYFHATNFPWSNLVLR